MLEAIAHGDGIATVASKQCLRACAVRSRTPCRQTEGMEIRQDGPFSSFNLAACLCFEHGRERARTPKCWARPFSLIESCLSVPSLLGILPHAAASDLQHSPILASFWKLLMLGYVLYCVRIFAAWATIIRERPQRRWEDDDFRHSRSGVLSACVIFASAFTLRDLSFGRFGRIRSR